MKKLFLTIALLIGFIGLSQNQKVVGLVKNGVYYETVVGNDSLSGTLIKTADLGDISVASGVWSVDDQAVASSEVSYDNTISGLTATEIKSAIDELSSLSGDVTSSGSVTTIASLAVEEGMIAAGAITESKLKTVNAAVDEYSVTYESTTGDFEYHQRPNSDIPGRTSTTPVTDFAIQSQANYTTDGAPAPGQIVFIDDAVFYDYVQIALSDLTTDLTTGDVKGYWVAPADGEIASPALNGVSIYLLTAGTGTGITMEIDKNGTPLTTTGITTDVGQNDSDDATVDFALTTYTFVRGDKFAFNFDAVPTSAAGAIATLRVFYDEKN